MAGSGAQEVRKARTRARLVEAARGVFNRDGFHDTRLSEIPAHAGLSTGTFYNYFTSKEEVFQAVMEVVLEELQHEHDAQSSALHDPPLPPADSIRRANRRYLTVYRSNARLMADTMLLASVNPAIMDIKHKIDWMFEDRLVRALARWQKRGLAVLDLDPVYTANSLAYMVDRFAHEFYFTGKDYDEDMAIDVLTTIWVRALGICENSESTEDPD